MKSKITLSAVAALVIVAALVAAGCAKQSHANAEQMPQPVMQEQPAVVPEVVPEIAQAEQSVDEIGMQELDEMEKDSDELVLP